MSCSVCNPCDTFTCGCDIMECIDTLLLGRIPLLNTQVYVHVLKQNGAEYIHAVTSSGIGEVTIDMSNPDKAFYNNYDGSYLLAITQGGYYCDGDRLTVTAPGGTYTQLALNFRKSEGVPYTTQHVQLV